jgi:hypothetical protein
VPGTVGEFQDLVGAEATGAAEGPEAHQGGDQQRDHGIADQAQEIIGEGLGREDRSAQPPISISATGKRMGRA